MGTYGQSAWYEPLFMTCIDDWGVVRCVSMDDVGWWNVMVGCVDCVCKRKRLEVGGNASYTRRH